MSERMASSEVLTIRMDPRGGPNIITRTRAMSVAQRSCETAADRARECWADAEARAVRSEARRAERARQREAGFALAVKYGLI